MKTLSTGSLGIGLVIVILLLAFGPCVERVEIDNQLSWFKLSVTPTNGIAQGDGSLETPYAYPTSPVTLAFEAEAYDQQGRFMPNYHGRAVIKVTPGELAPTSIRVVHFVEGKAVGEIEVQKVFGQVAVWFEDIHAIPLEDHQAPQGLLKKVPQRKLEGTWATGVSNLLHFSQPTLKQLQFDATVSNNDFSALPGYFVELNCRPNDPSPVLPDDGHGKLVVTGIFNEGFYVTDTSDSGGYNHLYVYSYSFPQNLEVGDRLDALSGSSQDFSGCTQISFPSWKRATDADLNPLPYRVTDLDRLLPPMLLTTSLCNHVNSSHMCGHSKSNLEIEKFESARMRVESVLTPGLYVNCDFNADQEVVADWVDAESLEARCQNACLKRTGREEIIVGEFIVDPAFEAEVVLDGAVICPWESDIEDIAPRCKKIRIPAELVCSELSALRQYGQWTVALDAGTGPLLNVETETSWPNFRSEAHLNVVFEYLQGNLHHVRAARPRWILKVGNGANDVPAIVRELP